MAMMENDTDIVGDKKLLFEITMNDTKDSVCEVSVVKDVLTQEIVSDSTLIPAVDCKRFLPQNNIPSIELPDPSTCIKNEHFVNNCVAGHAAGDLLTAVDEGFNEERVFPGESSSDDTAGTDRSSSIGSANDLTPCSAEEQHSNVVELQNNVNKIPCKEINKISCSDTENKSPISNRTPLNDVLSPSRHSNVFELAFLQNLEKPDSLFSCDNAKPPSAASSSEGIALSTASLSGTEYISDHVTMNISVHSLMSDKEVIQDHEPISFTPVTSAVVVEDELNNAVTCPGISFHEGLKDDAKLWCQTYVKLVDCANLLLLTIPSVITDTVLERKSPTTLKTEIFSEDKNISQSRHSKDLGAVSILERIGKPHMSDGSSLCDDNNSHSDHGRKKRQRRSRKVPENKAPRSQSKSPRRIVFSSCKANRKRSHDGDPDEVICKLDAWKKLHKSKAKADKQESLNALSSCAAHGVTVKQEPLDDFGSLSFPNENQFTSVLGDSWHAQVKTELVSDTDVFTALHRGDQISELPLVEPKRELTDSDFAFIKQEPADDYLYMENCDTSELDNQSITPLFPIDNVVSLASAQIEVSGARYDLCQILQDKHLQPSVVLKRFPIWILQKLQKSPAGLNIDSSPVVPPQSEEVSGYWGSSFVTQGSLQYGSEALPLSITSGYNSESDSLTVKLSDSTVPQSQQVLTNSEDKSSQKIDASPLEDVAQPLTKCFKSASASKVYAPKTDKVRGRKKKREEAQEESSSTLSENLVTKVSTEPKSPEMPKHALRSRKNSKAKPQIPEESEKPPEKEDVGKCPDKDKPGEISHVEPALPMEKIPKVSTVEKKHKNDDKEKASKVECVERVPKSSHPERKTRASKDPVEKVPSVPDTKRIQKSKADEKVPVVKERVTLAEEKKSKPKKLGFVIPKKKPPDPKAVFLGTSQHKTILNPASSISTFSRIPKVPKALSEEDKERSVLAKLDKDIGKREALKWDSRSGWTSKNSGTLSSNPVDSRGFSSQDKQQEEKWQRTGVDRYHLQNLKEPEMHPLVSHQQQQPKVPLLGLGPSSNAVSSEWNRSSNATNRDWINSNSLDMGQPQNSATGSFSSQPSHVVEEHRPIPTVGYSIPVIQTMERWKTNRTEVPSVKLNCKDERGTPLTEPVILDRSDPVLREVPYVSDEPDEVFSCSYGNDDDDDDDNSKGTDKLQIGRPCEILASSSSAALSQSFPLLEDLPVADNMDDSIRLFAEAVQEAIEQGDISPGKCDRLLNLYEKLCQDLTAEDATESQQNTEAAGIICDTIHQTMFKDLRLTEGLRKNRQIGTSFGGASDLLRNFGNADKCPSRGNSVDYVKPKTIDQRPCRGGNEDAVRLRRSALYGDREYRSNASGIYQQEIHTDRASGSTSFDDWTNRSFAILEDDGLWRDLLAQGQSPGMSEESLELLRRLLLEAAKKGVYDEQMVNMLNIVCQHIKLEDSKEQSLRKDFGTSSAFQHSVRNENVEIPFLSEERHFTEINYMSKKFQKQDDEQCARRPVSPLLSSKLQTGSYEVHEMSDLESEAAIEAKFAPDRVVEDMSAAEKFEQVKRKQEAFATKVLDELRLLEMLVAIQRELVAVSCSEYLPAATSVLSAGPEGQPAEPIQLTEPTKLAELSMSHISPSELSKAVESSIESTQPPALSAAPIQPVVEKTSSESCNTPSLASEPLTHPPSTSTAGDESQDSCNAQKTAKGKDTITDKKSDDPKAIEDKVISMARNALKPHYHNGAITSDEFKLIMKKAIAKICKSRSKDISQKRITKFMNAYVEKVIQSRK